MFVRSLVCLFSYIVCLCYCSFDRRLFKFICFFPACLFVCFVFVCLLVCFVLFVSLACSLACLLGYEVVFVCCLFVSIAWLIGYLLCLSALFLLALLTYKQTSKTNKQTNKTNKQTNNNTLLVLVLIAGLLAFLLA